MLGNDFKVIIPDLEEIRQLEQSMEQFKLERKGFLKQHELGRVILNKIQKRETSNFVQIDPPANGKTPSASHDKELNISQVAKEKASTDRIWDQLGFGDLLQKSTGLASGCLL